MGLKSKLKKGKGFQKKGLAGTKKFISDPKANMVFKKVAKSTGQSARKLKSRQSMSKSDLMKIAS